MNRNVKLIRSISCIAVVLCHIGLVFPNSIRCLFEFGAEGVRCFFILSGYLMLFSKELLQGDTFGYYKKRIIRIFPIYYLTITIYFLMNLAGVFYMPADSSGFYWFRYYFFFNTSVPSNELMWINLGGTWTISYFMLFYLIAPALRRILSNWIRCIVSIIPLIILGAIIIPDGYAEPVKGLYAFVLGMMIFYAINEKRIYESIVFMIIIGLLFHLYGLDNPYAYTFFLGCLMIALLSSDRSYIFEVFRPVVNFVDKHSYTIYLIHGLVLTAILPEWSKKGVQGAVIVVLFSIILSCIVDAPINYAISKIRNQKNA